MSHTPVLLHEVIKVLDPKPGDFIIDGTLGSGGHANELIKRIAPRGIFLGVDRDRNATRSFKNSEHTVKAYILQANYAELPEILRKLNLPKADALLLDLGFSSTQLVGRGMSFQSDEPLTMTYDNESAPVKDLLKQLSEAELTKVLREFGEERFAGPIASRITRYVKAGKMETTHDLVKAVMEAVPERYKHGRRRHGGAKIHPATRTFQALRIYANQELENLKLLLKNLDKIIKPKGRAAIISFHSLEDRIVKQAFQDRGRGGSPVQGANGVHAGEVPDSTSASLITKKPITPSEAEVRLNPRARSAKLRALML